MMCSDEVITLQFGHYSNFVGSHWWNIQNASFEYEVDESPEINYDVLYREGENDRKEVTYTPRLLLVDLNNSLGGLSSCGKVYDEIDIPDLSENSVLWATDKVQVEYASNYDKNEFLVDMENEDKNMISVENLYNKKSIRRFNLDEKVHVWSDFLGIKFHPRTVTVINEYQHGNENELFDLYNQGIDVWKTELFKNEWSDKCRLFVEECNSLQGFQILFDCIDGFSGLTCSAVEYLQDEYLNKAIISFPNIASSYGDSIRPHNGLRIINSVLAFSELIELTPIFVPLSVGCNGWDDLDIPRKLDNLQYNEKMWYHSSAILAAFLDTVSVSYRRRKNSNRLSDLVSILGPCGRKLLTGTMKLPFPIHPESSVLESFKQLDNPFWTALTPKANVTVDSSAFQEINVRGLSSYKLLPPFGKKTANPTFECNTIEEMLISYFDFCSSYSHKPMSKINVLKRPLKIPPSFPNIFDSRVTHTGCISSTPFPPIFAVGEAPVISALHNCSTSSSSLLNYLHEKASKINLHQLHYYSQSSLEQLEFSESLEKIHTLNDNYI